jgi:hypothetical protein
MFDAKRLLFGLLRSQMTGSRSNRVQRGFGGSTPGGIGGGLLGSLAMTALQSYMKPAEVAFKPCGNRPAARIRFPRAGRGGPNPRAGHDRGSQSGW